MNNLPVYDNVLNRDFKSVKPNMKMVSDITYIPTDEGWLYLAAVMDLCGRKIVGMSMDSRMTKQLTIDALNDAVNHSGDVLIIDRRKKMKKYLSMLKIGLLFAVIVLCCTAFLSDDVKVEAAAKKSKVVLEFSNGTKATKKTIFYRKAGTNIPDNAAKKNDKGFAQTCTFRLSGLSDGEKVTWKSSDSNIAKVSKKGKVTAISEGTAIVTATSKGKTYKCKITVRPSGFSLGDSAEFSIGDTAKLKINGDTPVSFKSSKSSVVKVSSKGKLTAKKAGKAVVTAVCKKGTYQISITVNNGIKYSVHTAKALSDNKPEWIEGEPQTYWYSDCFFVLGSDFIGMDYYGEFYNYQGDYICSVSYGNGGGPHKTLIAPFENSDIAYIDADGSDYLKNVQSWGSEITVCGKDGNIIGDYIISSASTPKISSENWIPYSSDNGVLVPSAVYGNIIELSYMDWEHMEQDKWGYLDAVTGDIYPIGSIELPTESYPDNGLYPAVEYDASKWSCYQSTGIDGKYFVGTADGSKWGYVDSAGNVIAMYPDATNFSANGYALVTDDGKSYYFIDRDFKAYREYSFEGAGASLNVPGGKTFIVTKADGTRYAVHMAEQ